MKFLALFSMRETATQAKVAEAIARRGEYKFPQGIKLVAEYWTPVQSPSVIAVFESDNPAAMMANSLTWLDVFDVNVVPILEWNEAAKEIAKLLPKK